MTNNNIKYYYNPKEAIDTSIKAIFENMVQKMTVPSLNNAKYIDRIEQKTARDKLEEKKLDDIMNKKLKQEHLLAVSSYTNYATLINNFLRFKDGYKYDASIKRNIKHIDNAINESPTLINQILGNKNIPILTGRVVKDRGIFHKENLLSSFPMFYDAAYMSTSIDLDWIMSSIFLERKEDDILQMLIYVIVTKKGIRIFPSYTRADDYQFEVILPRSYMFKTLGYSSAYKGEFISERNKLHNQSDALPKYKETRVSNFRFILIEQLEPTFKINRDLYDMNKGTLYPKDTKIYISTK
ncbi:hypothetical protein ACFX5K_06210 [Rickettsiales bacterium LUAb2]